MWLNVPEKLLLPLSTASTEFASLVAHAQEHLDDPECKAARVAARDEFAMTMGSDDRVQIDAGCPFSVADKGIWVQAWILMPRREESPEPEAEEEEGHFTIGKRYCVSLDLVGGLRMPDHELAHCLVPRGGGPNLTPAECREQFVHYLREGYEVLPSCDNHDAKGYCKGHPIPIDEQVGIPADVINEPTTAHTATAAAAMIEQADKGLKERT